MILGFFHGIIYIAFITCFILTQLYTDKSSYDDEGVDEDQTPIDDQAVAEYQEIGVKLEEKVKQVQENEVSEEKEKRASIGELDKDETRDETRDEARDETKDKNSKDQDNTTPIDDQAIAEYQEIGVKLEEKVKQVQENEVSEEKEKRASISELDKDETKDKNGKDQDNTGDDSKIVAHNESVEGIFITEKHAADTNHCGSYVGYYKSASNSHIGKPAWFTKDLLEKFLPDLMSKKEIVDHLYTGSTQQYHAEQFVITFKCKENIKCGSNINFTWGAPSNMWCNKEGEQGDAGSLCPKEFLNHKTSVCCSSTAPYYDYIYSRNFFLTDKCPNLILDLKEKELEECAGKTIVARLESPLIILDYYNKVIDKDGNNTGIGYGELKPYLNPNGTMKDCGDNVDCQKYAKIVDQVLWTSDKEVKLKIPENIGEKSSHSPVVINDQNETIGYINQEDYLI